eukprot:Hpha_TRINITY_DN5226_c0_g1::TRINITY_DN5226_c0_g1_i1::g.116648::m.116648
MDVDAENVGRVTVSVNSYVRDSEGRVKLRVSVSDGSSGVCELEGIVNVAVTDSDGTVTVIVSDFSDVGNVIVTVRVGNVNELVLCFDGVRVTVGIVKVAVLDGNVMVAVKVPLAVAGRERETVPDTLTLMVAEELGRVVVMVVVGRVTVLVIVAEPTAVAMEAASTMNNSSTPFGVRRRPRGLRVGIALGALS